MMKKFISGALAFLMAAFISPSFSQDTTGVDSKALTEEGNRLIEKGHFAAALPVWQRLLEKNPGNADLNFKVGLCYRYFPDQKEKALEYFKKAATQTVSRYNFYSMTWGQASFDAIYFLGETYLTVNEPDSALKYFLLYNDLYNGNPPISTDRQVRATLNARNAVKTPRNVKLVNMGEALNSPYAESNPVLTLDNSVIFFSSRRPGKEGSSVIDKTTGQYAEDIYYSRRDKNGKWQAPQAFRHNTSLSEAPLSLSPDGLTLYFRKEEKNGDVNLYKSVFANGVWGDPARLEGTINSSARETGFTLSPDGSSLYFTSDRVGGQGGTDIYQCLKQKNGRWSKARNLGTSVNTAYNETSPFIGSNGRTLFYCSNGHKSKGIGGYDVFFTELKEDGSWSDPQNIGYPINTTRDNPDYYISGGGLRYCSALNDNKSFDLYEIQGGGFEVENIDVGTEVVMLTTEMSVTEVVEVQKEVVKEVEVVQMVEGMEESKPGETTEVVNVEEAAADSAAAPASDTLAMNTPEPEAQPEPEPEKPKLDIDVEAIDMANLDSLDRVALIDKVKKYLVSTMKTSESVVFKTLYFDFNSASLSLLSRNELKLLLDFLKENPSVKLEIAGHTDNIGSWSANSRVSSSRARMVKDYLVSHRVSESRILHYGKANASPIATNDTEEGRKANRRVEIVLVK
jgi:outer membrane protein OmpA-like peptidoglycan-associated protein